jgi:hypothetical protein
MTTVSSDATFRERLDAVAALAGRTNKATVLVVQQFPVAEDCHIAFPSVRESIANIMAFVELGTARDLSHVLDLAGSAFNWIAVDCDHKRPDSAAIVETARARVPPEQLLYYSDNQVWFDSGLDIVQRLEGGVTGKSVLLCGSGPLAECFAQVLPRLGATLVTIADVISRTSSASIVLGVSQKRQTIGEDVIAAISSEAAIYDIGLGNLSVEAASSARARGLRLYRLDNRAGVSSAIVRLLETDHMVGRLMGQVRIKDVDIVAGGLLGPAGAVIVDDIRDPILIFGVADGAGRFKESPDSVDRARIEFVRSLIKRAASA